MIDLIDLRHRGIERVLATALLPAAGGVAIVDPGPTSCLRTLEEGLARRGWTLRDVKALLLTHVHLDHAGAAGTIVARVPGVRVLVHEAGAPHLVDPSKLVASATRLYHDQMASLWGAVDPVPAGSVETLKGGERVDLGALRLLVADTPGHAKHHVSYFDERTGTAFVGDTAGIRVGADHLVAPTPPPDIDLAAWHESLDRIEAWRPVSLFLMHFGEVAPARAHLARFRAVLTAAAAAARELVERPLSDEARLRAFVEAMSAELRRAVPEREARVAERATSFEQSWRGLARYWEKQGRRAG